MDKIHLKAPKGWINDPNGFIYYKGKYHLFYQHFPYAPRWGRMHWGHAVSEDLTNWKQNKTALFPTKTNDAHGCFSGSAIEQNGNLYLFYTGVKYDEPDPENINCCLNDKFTSAQLMITSDDGISFDNFGSKKTVIPPIENSEIGNKNHTRDPKVWQGKDGIFYMVLGTTVNQKGRLLFYRSHDLNHWEYVNYAVSADSDADYGWMWECPDYFETDDNGVLIFSPMGTQNGSQSVCVLSRFDEKNCTLGIGSQYQYLDYGFDLYAPQSTLDKEGNRVVIAWLRMPDVMEDNTIGMMCIPRICEVHNRHIYFNPHPNIRNRFTKKIDSPNDCYTFSVNLENGEEINVGGYIIGRKNNRIYTDRTAVINGHTDIQNRFETPEIHDSMFIEVYVDCNIIEVFIGNGKYVISNAVYNLSNEITANISDEIKLYTTGDENEKI